MKKQHTYIAQAMIDLQKVRQGAKQVMIVSSGKSAQAVTMVAEVAEAMRIPFSLIVLHCEDGKLHEHAFVGFAIHRALELIRKGTRGTTSRRVRISRQRLQFDLGKLLGYSEDEILEFIASKVARECPCDCCGGAIVSKEEAQ